MEVRKRGLRQRAAEAPFACNLLACSIVQHKLTHLFLVYLTWEDVSPSLDPRSRSVTFPSAPWVWCRQPAETANSEPNCCMHPGLNGNSPWAASTPQSRLHVLQLVACKKKERTLSWQTASIDRNCLVYEEWLIHWGSHRLRGWWLTVC